MKLLIFISSIFIFSIPGLAASTSTSSVDNANYYKLHQATGFYEQYLGGHCEIGKNRALSYLKTTQAQKLHTELQSKIDELENKIKMKSSSIYDLESFRLSIHEMQNKLGFNHEQRWHDEVVASCAKKAKTQH